MSLSVAISHAFDDFELDVAFHGGPGVTALFGPSGAGKTTIVNAIAGLIKPQEGRIEIDGDMVFDSATGYAQPPQGRGIGYVFQDSRLFPHMTVLENLRYGARFSDRPIVIGEQDVIDLLGIAPILARRPGTLSGGEKQRVALGRALLCQPRLLLMDEPLAALDEPRKDEVLPYLERLRSEASLPILYISHAMREIARLADHLIVLSNGKVATSGPVTEVLSDPTLIPLIGVREAGSLLEAKLIAHTDDGLSTLELGPYALSLPQIKAPIGARIRLRILAQDVIIARNEPQGLSANNILKATIAGVHLGDGPGAAVVLDLAGQRLLARVTRRAVDQLGLAPGQACYAILKSMAIAPGAIGAGPIGS